MTTPGHGCKNSTPPSFLPDHTRVRSSTHLELVLGNEALPKGVKLAQELANTNARLEDLLLDGSHDRGNVGSFW